MGIISAARSSAFPGVVTGSPASLEKDTMAGAQALHAGEMRQAAISPTASQIGTPDVSGYDASTRNVNNATDTVEGRIGGIISQNSPLIQMSQTRAKQEANARGTLNSTMAVQAGESAAYGAALPIAQQDAANANDVANRNQADTNTSRQFNAGASNTGSLAKFGADTTHEGQLLQGQQQLGQIAASGAQQRETAMLTGQQQLEQIGAQGTQQRQTQQQVGEQALKQLQEQGGQARLTDAQQNAAAQTLQSQRAQLDIQVHAAAQAGDEASKARLLAQQGDLDKQMELVRSQQAQTLQAQKAELDKQIQAAAQAGDEASKSRLMAQSAEADQKLVGLKLQNDLQLQGLKGTQDLTLQGLKGNQALDVAQIEAGFKTLMQTSDSAARIWTQSSASISSILLNPDTTPEVKQSQIDQQIALLRTGFEVAGAIGNVDLGALLDTTGA